MTAVGDVSPHKDAYVWRRTARCGFEFPRRKPQVTLPLLERVLLTGSFMWLCSTNFLWPELLRNFDKGLKNTDQVLDLLD